MGVAYSNVLRPCEKGTPCLDGDGMRLNKLDLAHFDLRAEIDSVTCDGALPSKVPVLRPETCKALSPASRTTAGSPPSPGDSRSSDEEAATRPGAPRNPEELSDAADEPTALPGGPSAAAAEEAMGPTVSKVSFISPTVDAETEKERIPSAGLKPAIATEEPVRIASLFEVDREECQKRFGSTKGKRYAEVRFESRAVYRGQWANEFRHGFGVQEWPGGYKYEGEWQFSTACGRGRLTFPDGDVFIGQWRNNMFHGLGVYRSSAAGTEYCGEWRAELRHGFGVEFSSGKEGSKFAGCFKDGQRNRFGVCVWNDGGVYRGSWKEGQCTGVGVHNESGGAQFRGHWRYSMRHGFGEYCWPDGRRFTGEYVCGKASGLGCTTSATGQKEWGFFRLTSPRRRSGKKRGTSKFAKA